MNEKEVALIEKLISEKVEIVSYDPEWKKYFEREKKYLRDCLPNNIIGRIEHFGSTAVPDLDSKPIIDILVEVTCLKKTREKIVPILESKGYDYIWRPTIGNEPPFYAWFIKRNSEGQRTHHIHMVESDFEHWDRLLFRDYLIEHSDIAKQYQRLKTELVKKYSKDRIAYTEAKTEFISRITEEAKRYYSS